MRVLFFLIAASLLCSASAYPAEDDKSWVRAEIGKDSHGRYYRSSNHFLLFSEA
jgi:hypothetical protein